MNEDGKSCFGCYMKALVKKKKGDWGSSNDDFNDEFNKKMVSMVNEMQDFLRDVEKEEEEEAEGKVLGEIEGEGEDRWIDEADESVELDGSKMWEVD